jgi:hemoglobin-like flavoprotein
MTIHESMKAILNASQQGIGEVFYRRLFAQCPAVEPLFREINLAHQATILTMSLQMIAAHAERPTLATTEYLRIIGHRHDLRHVGTDMYAPFQSALLETLAEFHGPDWNTELSAAWKRAIETAVACMREGYVKGALHY